MSTKALPASVSAFGRTFDRPPHAGPSNGQRERVADSPGQPTSPAFRSSHSGGWQQQQQQGGTDEDLGRFAEYTPPNAAAGRASSKGKARERDGGIGQAVGRYPSHWDGSRVEGAATDGQGVLELFDLGAQSLVDSVDGDWEKELHESQTSGWRAEYEAAVPRDPAVAANSLSFAQDRPDAGRDSPTSSALLSSLSSIDLSDKLYLSTLLAQPSSRAMSSYLEMNQYTDDVYALPPSVRAVLDQAKAAGDGGSGEDSRTVALRRLRLVQRHLFPGSAAPSSPATTPGIATPRETGGEENDFVRAFSSSSSPSDDARGAEMAYADTTLFRSGNVDSSLLAASSSKEAEQEEEDEEVEAMKSRVREMEREAMAQRQREEQLQAAGVQVFRAPGGTMGHPRAYHAPQLSGHPSTVLPRAPVPLVAQQQREQAQVPAAVKEEEKAARRRNSIDANGTFQEFMRRRLEEMAERDRWAMR